MPYGCVTKPNLCGNQNLPISSYMRRGLYFTPKKKKKKRFATFVSLSDIFRSVLSNGSAYFVTLSVISWRLWQSKKLFEKNKVLGTLVLWWLRQLGKGNVSGIPWGPQATS